METTLAVADYAYALSNYKKERIFFKDQVRRKENDSSTDSSEPENKKELSRGRDGDDRERSYYASSQIMYIDESVIMNGLAFAIPENEVGTAEPSFTAMIADMERVLLEHYVQTFSHTRHTCYADVSKILVFQQQQEQPAPGATVLYVTGVWETDQEIGLEYEWIRIL